ncbi:MAG: hypothetical protein SNJ77_08700 [Cytophagales bacterium]
MSFIFGSAYNLMLSDDYFDNPDVKTYMSIANADFEDQSLVRRYRVLVPFMAKTVTLPFESVYSQVWKKRTQSDAPLRLGFLIVNVVFMSLAGLIIFEICNFYSLNSFLSFAGTMVFLLAGRWGSIISGLPYTDSLYILLISALWLGVLIKNTHLILVSVILGFLAKESFIFFVPLIVLGASKKNVFKLVFSTILGVSLAVLVRYYVDFKTNTPMFSSVEKDLDHFQVIWLSVLRIFNLRGVGELCTVLGVFSLINILGVFSLYDKTFRSTIFKKLNLSFWLFSLIIWVHALLSNEVGRMLYIGGAAWTVFMVLTVQHHSWFRHIHQFIEKYNFKELSRN